MSQETSSDIKSRSMLNPQDVEFEEPPPSYNSATNRDYNTDSDSDSDSDFESTSSLSTEPDESQPKLQRRVPTRSNSGSHLQKPIAIPATNKKLGSPFLRAFPPALEGFGLPREAFLHFLDDLNRAAVANPPLQVLGLAGDIVGFVPVYPAPIVGNAVSAGARIGVYAVSKGRTEMALRKANKDIFKPRGLKVEIARIDAVAKLAGMPVLNEKDKIDKKTPLLNPIENIKLSRTVSGQQRRLNALEPWIATLDLEDLPEVQTPKNPLSKWSAAASEKQRERGERRLKKGRDKTIKNSAQHADNLYEVRMAKLEKKMEESEITDLRYEKRKEKIERMHDKRLRKAEKRTGKDREEKAMRKILWLIIRNLDADSGNGPDPFTGDVSE